VSVTNSLAALFPQIAVQWHPTKNGDLTPAEVIAGSHQSVWWKCDVAEDHEWKTPPKNRAFSKSGCPCCANKQVSITNNLAVLFPKVAAQWHPTKNGDLTPAEVIAGSNKKFWWKCEVADDHEWQVQASERTQGKGCPFCAGQRVSVTNSLEAQFPKIAAQWHPTKNGDLLSSEVVSGSGKKFWWKCDVADDHEWKASASHRTRSETGCPQCAGQRVSVSNSLATLFPEVAAEWHPIKNGGLTPADVTTGTNKKFWWKCDVADDHEWKTSCNDRTRKSQGCPCCSGKQLSTTNNLTELFPDVAAQWHPTKNGDLTPADVRVITARKFWWKCDVAEDHEWQAPVRNRAALGVGCPACNGKQVSTTNSLTELFPDVAAQWHPTRNGDLIPAEVVAGSQQKFWWKCDVAEDHEWLTTAASRTSVSRRGGGSGCPSCSNHQLSTTNSLAINFPEVTAQWHSTKNRGITPAEIVASTPEKYWWKCNVAEDHEWFTGVRNRTNLGHGCPCCSGHQLSVTNSLVQLFPAVASEWHPIKNDDVKVTEIVAGANRRFWWRCLVSSDHEWATSVANRTRHGSGCPSCTLTPRSAQEMRLAHELSSLIDFDLKTHKVHFAGRLRDVDIVVDDLKVVVEFDGAYWHQKKVDKDREKTVLMEEAGWQVIRVRERPLDSIHVNDVMVDTMAPAKTVADLVLNKISEVTGTDVPQLDEYLASEGPWREAQALKAIRAYQAERAAKKAARANKAE